MCTLYPAWELVAEPRVRSRLASRQSLRLWSHWASLSPCLHPRHQAVEARLLLSDRCRTTSSALDDVSSWRAGRAEPSCARRLLALLDPRLSGPRDATRIDVFLSPSCVETHPLWSLQLGYVEKRRRMRLIRPTTPRRARSSSAVVVGAGLVAWMLVSDDWDALLNDAHGATVLGVVAGVLMAATLLALIALTSAATRRRRGR